MYLFFRIGQEIKKNSILKHSLHCRELQWQSQILGNKTGHSEKHKLYRHRFTAKPVQSHIAKRISKGVICGWSKVRQTSIKFLTHVSSVPRGKISADACCAKYVRTDPFHAPSSSSSSRSWDLGGAMQWAGKFIYKKQQQQYSWSLWVSQRSA